VKRYARTVAWFDFAELCGGAHAQEDYLAIAQRFPTLFLSDIPKMTAEHAAEMRRFIWLIDVLYDHNVRLVASAAATQEQLDAEGVTAGEFARTASRLSEMQSQRYLQLPHRAQGVTLNE
jgi:cell division protein ZapE